jgi:hypothetical protein
MPLCLAFSSLTLGDSVRRGKEENLEEQSHCGSRHTIPEKDAEVPPYGLFLPCGCR